MTENILTILSIIRSDPNIDVESLTEALSRRLKVKRYEAAEMIYQLIEEKKINLQDPIPPQRILDYTFSFYNIWFWIVLTLAALTTLSIYMLPSSPPLVYLRYIVGSVFVLYLPGCAVIEALYPGKTDLSGLERIALSIGLSLVLTPLIGLVLNFTPWGIKLTPVFTTLTLVTVLLSILAVGRKFSRFHPPQSRAR